MEYEAFLESRYHERGDGFEADNLPPQLFDFQRHLVQWALKRGRAAIFADCGLGKTLMQLAWADAVAKHTGRPVLIVTPLAVSFQTVAEAGRFRIDAARSQDGSITAPVMVTNYQRLGAFDSLDFSGVVCDESSILKNFDGSTRAQITQFMRSKTFRLLCTATAAPNDYTELGTSSEALGELGHMDMLTRFFRNEQGNASHRTGLSTRHHHAEPGKTWRFKGHAETPFWRWVCSWARVCRRPSDIGFDDGRFVLPTIVERQHLVKPERPADGMLFDLPANGLKEQREERRRTIPERCDKVAELCSGSDQAIVWCHLNEESERLTDSIDGAVEVAGSDPDDDKEAKLLAFSRGDARVLVTKPRIGAFGLNLQNCHRMTFFPSHSYEEYYQGVRRCWRFGQDHQVTVDVVTSPGEANVLANVQRKAAAADRMFDELVKHVGSAVTIRSEAGFQTKTEVPSWLSASK